MPAEEYMKNILKKMLVLPLAAVLAACGSTSSAAAVSEMPLEEVMDRVYEGIDADSLPMFGEDVTVTSENEQWYLGTEDAVFDEAIAREPLIGSIAHSVVLLRVDDEKQLDSTMELIRDSVDTRKWVCVGIEPLELVLEKRGNVILLAIVEDAAVRDTLKKNFESI